MKEGVGEKRREGGRKRSGCGVRRCKSRGSYLKEKKMDERMDSLHFRREVMERRRSTPSVVDRVKGNLKA